MAENLAHFLLELAAHFLLVTRLAHHPVPWRIDTMPPAHRLVGGSTAAARGGEGELPILAPTGSAAQQGALRFDRKEAVCSRIPTDFLLQSVHFPRPSA